MLLCRHSQQRSILLIRKYERCGIVLLTSLVTLAKDPEPFLKSAAMPFYPGVAQGETENVEATSGHPLPRQFACEMDRERPR